MALVVPKPSQEHSPTVPDKMYLRWSFTEIAKVKVTAAFPVVKQHLMN